MTRKNIKDNRRRITIDSNKIYKNFIEKRSIGKYISNKKWSKYAKIIAETIVEYLFKGNILYLPYGMGIMYIEKSDALPYILQDENGNDIPNYKKVNLEATKLKRRQLYPNKDKSWFKQPENRFKGIVFFEQIDSDYDYKLIWKSSKENKFLKNTYLKLWRFMFSQSIRKQLQQYIKNNNKLPAYYEKYYNKNNTRIYRKEITRECSDVERRDSRKYMASNEINRSETRSGIFFNFGNTRLQS